MWLCRLINSHCLSMSSIRDPTEGGTATLPQWLLPRSSHTGRRAYHQQVHRVDGRCWLHQRVPRGEVLSRCQDWYVGTHQREGPWAPLPILGTRWEQMPDLGLGSLLIKSFVSGTIYEGASNIQLNTIARRIDAEY